MKGPIELKISYEQFYFHVNSPTSTLFDLLILDAIIDYWQEPSFFKYLWQGNVDYYKFRSVKTKLCCVLRDGQWWIQDPALFLFDDISSSFSIASCCWSDMVKIADLNFLLWQNKYTLARDFRKSLDTAFNKTDYLRLNPLRRSTAKERSRFRDRLVYA